MVLPIIVGLGLTAAALTFRSGLRAYYRYVKLTPTMIAHLNGIHLSKPHTQNDVMKLKFAQYPGGFFNPITESEALLILGIPQSDIVSLTHEKLKKRHRQCMLINHPDKGGSPFLAMKINQAKEVLEKSYMFRK
ncbi:BA75_02464T0 [Komagataella pastoris]|uniref:BA75_02464T0 n=1 Tax=Komagataella pastoris TaxID=4922 RepID=A0A1B2JCL2_PICPA|nr:BA75_02464T0 [Komagataella pastoris]